MENRTLTIHSEGNFDYRFQYDFLRIWSISQKQIYSIFIKHSEKLPKTWKTQRTVQIKFFTLYLQKLKTSSCDTVPLGKEIGSNYRRQRPNMGGGGIHNFVIRSFNTLTWGIMPLIPTNFLLYKKISDFFHPRDRRKASFSRIVQFFYIVCLMLHNLS